MSAKETAQSLIEKLDDNADWTDVKDAIMPSYQRETGDAKADAIAAVALILVFVTTCIFWVSIQ